MIVDELRKNMIHERKISTCWIKNRPSICVLFIFMLVSMACC